MHHGRTSVRPSRPGSALVIVLALALLMAAQIYILMLFTTGGFRHVESAISHVRAVYVGESAFSGILARLKGGPWQDRWFKTAAAVERDVSLLGGTYSSYVSTVSGVTDKLVDVWIESRFEGSVTVMYYRVLYVDDTLDFSASVYPQFFTFLSDGDPNPLDDALQPSLALVQDLMQQQANNRANAMATLGQLSGMDRFSDIVTALGIQPEGEVPDRLTPARSDQPSPPQDQYNADVRNMLGALPPPPPAPTPRADAGGGGGGNPDGFIGKIKEIFAGHGHDLRESPSGQGSAWTPELEAMFSDPSLAFDDWKRGAHDHFGRGFVHWMDQHIPNFFHNLATQSEGRGALDPGNIILAQSLTELRLTATTRAAAVGQPLSTLPIETEVTPLPTWTPENYVDAFHAYRTWFIDVGGMSEQNAKNKQK